MWPNPQTPADFTEEILNEKLHFLCSVYSVRLNLSREKTKNSNQNRKVKKMVVFVKTFDYYHHNLNFGNFFSFLVKLKNNMKLKFWSKFNHGFTIIMVIATGLIEKVQTVLR